jgi:hypothetical protein
MSIFSRAPPRKSASVCCDSSSEGARRSTEAKAASTNASSW